MNRIIVNASLVIGFIILSVSTVSGQKKLDSFSTLITDVRGTVHLKVEEHCTLTIELEGGKHISPINLDKAHKVEGRIINFSYQVKEILSDAKCPYNEVVIVSSVIE